MPALCKAAGLFLFSVSAFAGVTEQVARTLSLFEKSGAEWRIPCVSCHHQAMAMIALDSARRHGIAVNEEAARMHVSKTLKPFLTSAEGVLTAPVDAFGMGFGMWAAQADGIAPTLVTSILARRFANWQLPDGHWAANDARPPLAASEFTSTALGIRALSAYLPEWMRGEREARFARARQWLLEATPTTSEDRAFQLLGLKWSGASRAERKRFARALLRLQRADGGWAQADGMESDAYATGQALYALRQGCGLSPDSEAYRRGSAFLLSTQQPDGAWLVRTRLHSPSQISPPFFDSGFPGGRDQFASFAGSAWAVLGLMEGLPETASPARPLPVEGASPSDAQPWMETAMFGSVEDLKRLLDGGQDVNIVRWVLPDAAKVRLLLERGAKVSDGDLLAAATYRGSAEAIELLLKQGVKMSPAAFGMAAAAGDLAVVKLMLAHGADAHLRPERGESPLMSAIGTNNGELVRLLVKHGADVNQRGQENATPLIAAALQHRTEMVRLLLELGADAQLTDQFGYTALRHTADIAHADPRTAEALRTR